LFVPDKEAEKTKYTTVSNEQDAGKKNCQLRMENKSFIKVAEFK